MSMSIFDGEWIIPDALNEKEKLGMMLMFESAGMSVQEEVMNFKYSGPEWPYLCSGRESRVTVTRATSIDGHILINYKDAVKELKKLIKERKYESSNSTNKS